MFLAGSNNCQRFIKFVNKLFYDSLIIITRTEKLSSRVSKNSEANASELRTLKMWNMYLLLHA